MYGIFWKPKIREKSFKKDKHFDSHNSNPHYWLEPYANSGGAYFFFEKPQADHPLLVGAVVDWNLSNDLLLFIEEMHMNNTVAIICSKMQNSKQIFQ